MTMSSDMDQTLLVIAGFFIALITLLVLVVHLESTLSRPKQQPSVQSGILRRLRRAGRQSRTLG